MLPLVSPDVVVTTQLHILNIIANIFSSYTIPLTDLLSVLPLVSPDVVVTTQLHILNIIANIFSSYTIPLTDLLSVLPLVSPDLVVTTQLLNIIANIFKQLYYTFN